jgi:hypothetical protein
VKIRVGRSLGTGQILDQHHLLPRRLGRLLDRGQIDLRVFAREKIFHRTVGVLDAFADDVLAAAPPANASAAAMTVSTSIEVSVNARLVSRAYTKTT